MIWISQRELGRWNDGDEEIEEAQGGRHLFGVLHIAYRELQPATISHVLLSARRVPG